MDKLYDLRSKPLDPFSEDKNVNPSKDKSWIGKLSNVMNNMNTSKYIGSTMNLAQSAVKSISDYKIDNKSADLRVSEGVCDIKLDWPKLNRLFNTSDKYNKPYVFDVRQKAILYNSPENCIFEFKNDTENFPPLIEDEIVSLTIDDCCMIFDSKTYINFAKQGFDEEFLHKILKDRSTFVWYVKVKISFTDRRLLIQPYQITEDQPLDFIEYMLKAGFFTFFRGQIDKFIIESIISSGFDYQQGAFSKINEDSDSILIECITHTQSKFHLIKANCDNHKNLLQNIYAACCNHTRLYLNIYEELDDKLEPKNFDSYIDDVNKFMDYYDKIDSICFSAFRPYQYYQNLPQGKRFCFNFNNLNYQLCPTYPNRLPLGGLDMNDEQLKEIAQFRVKNRLPILSYRTETASLWRCSQPFASIAENRCEPDENLICNNLHIYYSDKVHIFDARPFVNAFFCKIAGAGYENINKNYANCEMNFAFIENIHKVATSYETLRKNLENQTFIQFDECKNTFTKVSCQKTLMNLLKSGWFDLLQSLLIAAYRIVDIMSKGQNVLVHCSDGWDRTAQLVSLTCIFFDPQFRTIEGFLALIEREFHWMGHMFSTRLGLFDNNSSQKSPIFLQFLDATATIMHQNEQAFEFSEKLIECIVIHSRSLIFGDFVFNSHKERSNKILYEGKKWKSLFRQILQYKTKFYNKNYTYKREILDLSTQPNKFPYISNIWTRYDLDF